MLADQALADRFGENLRRIRRRVDLSQEELAAMASVHRTEIGLLERGLRIPRTDTLIKLAFSLEVRADDLLDGIDWVPTHPGRGAFVVVARAKQMKGSHNKPARQATSPANR